MTSTPWCDGHQGRIRTRVGRIDVDDTYLFCVPCHQKIRSEDLTPGEDFEVGELWTTGDADEENDDE